MSGQDRPWAGRVAFITGAVTGIGLGAAQAFADAGMRLALSYRNEDDRARTAEWFASKGYEQPLFLKLDVTDRARFAEVAAEVVKHFGEVHVVVNNAGVSVFGPTDEASYDDYDWIMGVNFGGVVNGLVSFMPYLKAAKGRRQTSAMKRPDGFGTSGFPETSDDQLRQFGTAFEEGMDPYEVGTKILNGMTRQDGLILTHPEHGPDFEEIHAKTMAALPVEDAPAGRLKIEQLRRDAMKAAEEGLVINLDDLT